MNIPFLLFILLFPLLYITIIADSWLYFSFGSFLFLLLLNHTFNKNYKFAIVCNIVITQFVFTLFFDLCNIYFFDKGLDSFTGYIFGSIFITIFYIILKYEKKDYIYNIIVYSNLITIFNISFVTNIVKNGYDTKNNILNMYYFYIFYGLFSLLILFYIFYFYYKNNKCDYVCYIQFISIEFVYLFLLFDSVKNLYNVELVNTTVFMCSLALTNIFIFCIYSKSKKNKILIYSFLYFITIIFYSNYFQLLDYFYYLLFILYLLVLFLYLWKTKTMFVFHKEPIKLNFTGSLHKIINIIFLFCFIVFVINLNIVFFIGLPLSFNIINSFKFLPVNVGIWSILNDSYYFNNKINTSIDLYQDSYTYLDKNIIDKFSYIEESGKYNKNRSGFYYGFGFYFSRLDKNNIRILFVYHDSDAEKKGLVRGDIVEKINGINIIDFYGEKRNILKDKHTLILSVRRGDSLLQIKINKTDYNKAKVTYNLLQNNTILYYYQPMFSNEDYKTLEKYLLDFGIENIIVDFRYNSGGSFNIAKKLSELLIGSTNKNKLLSTIIYNEKYTENNYNIYSTYAGRYKGAKKVVFLTTKDTCSAPETVINMVNPYIEVSVVGTYTCGKPYIMETKEIGGKTLSIINAISLNALGSSVPLYGIKPNIILEEKITEKFYTEDDILVSKAINLINIK